MALEPVKAAPQAKAKAPEKKKKVVQKQPKKVAPAQDELSGSKLPKGKRLQALDAEENKIIKKEMQKGTGAHLGKVHPALRVKGAMATSGASAASDAALAANKAVGTLAAMKASADALADSQPPRTPSKEAVQAKIMEEARKSAAKTVARLTKEEASEQAEKKDDKEIMQFTQLTHTMLNRPAPKKVPGVMSEKQAAKIQHHIVQAAAVADKKSAAVQKMVLRAQKMHNVV